MPWQPYTPWSEIDLPEDIKRQVEESEEGIPDEVVLDATSGIPGLPRLETEEAALFLDAARQRAKGLGVRQEQAEAVDGEGSDGS